MITIEDLKKICPQVVKPERYIDAINECFEKYGFNTVNRRAMFLAQCLHESGCFRYTKEIWGPTTWQLKYEGHTGLGNTEVGDGKRFMGRGFIQVTGRANYTSFSAWCGDDTILSNPAQLEDKYAVLSAIWFWKTKNLDKFADADDIQGCTRVVNGKAMLGLNERTRYYLSGLQVL